MKFDFLGTADHFTDHLAPIWLALEPDERGTFYTGSSVTYAASKGIAARAVGLHHLSRSRADFLLVASEGDRKRARSLAPSVRMVRMQHGIGLTIGGEEGFAKYRRQDGVAAFLTAADMPNWRWQGKTASAPVVTIGTRSSTCGTTRRRS